MLKKQLTLILIIEYLNELQVEIWSNFPMHGKVTPTRQTFLKSQRHWGV